MKKICLQLIFFTLISVTLSSDLYKLILQPSERGAACLDGSPAGIYVHEGGNNKNVMIYLEGGGFCAG